MITGGIQFTSRFVHKTLNIVKKKNLKKRKRYYYDVQKKTLSLSNTIISNSDKILVIYVYIYL